jgi:hypothetical protein
MSRKCCQIIALRVIDLDTHSDGLIKSASFFAEGKRKVSSRPPIFGATRQAFTRRTSENDGECKNEKLGKEEVSAIIKTDIQDLANFFYNRDISNFDSTQYKKTEFHEDQVQLNWDSVQTFWHSVCTGELAEFDMAAIMETGIEKCDLYTLYLSG